MYIIIRNTSKSFTDVFIPFILFAQVDSHSESEEEQEGTDGQKKKKKAKKKKKKSSPEVSDILGAWNLYGVYQSISGIYGYVITVFTFMYSAPCPCT